MKRASSYVALYMRKGTAMNRWKRASSGLNTGVAFYHLREPAKTNIADNHNTVCDEYEAEIKRLESERDAAAEETRRIFNGLLNLTAERDELKRRCEKMVKMLDPGPEHPKWGHGICEECGWHGCFSSFVGRAGGELEDDDESLCPVCEDSVQDADRSIYVNLHARALAIAEGRDNG